MGSLNIFQSINNLIDAGGGILWLILFVSICMWSLILERYLYLRFDYPKFSKQLFDQWEARKDKTSWHSQKIREAMIAEVDLNLRKSILVIKSLVGLCPMLGLIGTVLGMIQVFDVMTYLGNDNARAMAAGVSMATIPTMAGMVIAISGIYFHVRLVSRIKHEVQLFRDHLTVV